MAQYDELKQKWVESRFEKAMRAIEEIDEVVCDRLNESEYASEDFKNAQRLSNAILNVKNAMEIVKYEL